MAPRFRTLLVLVCLVAASCGGGDTTVVSPTGEDNGTGVEEPVAAEEPTAARAPDGDVDADATDELGDATDDGSDGADAADDTGDDDDGADATDDTGDDVELSSAALSASAGIEGLEDDLPPEVIECAIGALLDDPELARAVIRSDSGELDDLPRDLFDRSIDIVLECLDDDTFADLVTSGFSDGDVDLPSGVPRCFAAELDTMEERRTLVRLGLADGAGDPDDADVALIVEAIVDCVPPEVWVEAMTAEVAGDAAFEEAFQADCMEDLFGDKNFVTDLMRLAITGDLDSDEITPAQAPLIRGIFDCMDFGAVIAAEAAADGVELSKSSADCISDGFRELGFIDDFIEGTEPDADEMGVLVIDCLSAEELSQLFG